MEKNKQTEMISNINCKQNIRIAKQEYNNNNNKNNNKRKENISIFAPLRFDLTN
jgi:hypothetical protein